MTPPDTPVPQPPATITLRWCPECGRKGVWGWHDSAWGGPACPGVPVALTYALVAPSDTRRTG